MNNLLSDYFKKIAYKKLSAVEADSSVSNQHEFNGISNLRDIFGNGKVETEVVQVYLDDQSEDPTYAKSKLTWYDAREDHPTRTEYRLYYKSSPVTDKFHEGDLMIIAQQTNGQLLNIFAKENSSAENQLKILFGISEITDKIKSYTVEGKNDERMDFIRDFIVEKLGIVDEKIYKDTAVNYLEEMIKRFPNGLPSTREFSDFARVTWKLTGVRALSKQLRYPK